MKPKDKAVAYRVAYKKSHPWHKTFVNVQKRCQDPRSKSFKYYGGKGIKCLLNYKDLEFLWHRDKASKMKTPSLDRLNPLLNYTRGNCRYIERNENIRLGWERRKSCVAE